MHSMTVKKKTYLSFSVPKMDARYSAIIGLSTTWSTSSRKREERVCANGTTQQHAITPATKRRRYYHIDKTGSTQMYSRFVKIMSPTVWQNIPDLHFFNWYLHFYTRNLEDLALLFQNKSTVHNSHLDWGRKMTAASSIKVHVSWAVVALTLNTDSFFLSFYSIM